MSSYRLRFGLSGALVWASSSTRATVGFRAMHGVHVHLAQGDSVVSGDARRHDFKIADLCDRLRALMGLDVADDDIDAPFLQAVSLLEHRIGFSHAGAGTEVDLQLPKLLAADDGQKVIRARAS